MGRRARHDRPHHDHVDGGSRAVRGGPAPDRGRACLRGGPRAGGAGAVHGDLGRRHRGGRVDHAPLRVRTGRPVSDAAEHPRRAVEGGPGWGTRDYEDVMAVVDEAVRRFDFVDGDRVGVMGGSYGGYMTSWIVGHTDRFAAACSERSCNNFLLEGGSADIGWMFEGEVGAFWFEDPDAYLKISPVTYATNITTPLLILHSENDLRCPVGHAEDLFTILRLLRREVELVRFPAESHELSRSGSPAHRVQRFEVILDWLERHLGNA